MVGMSFLHSNSQFSITFNRGLVADTLFEAVLTVSHSNLIIFILYVHCENYQDAISNHWSL
jgi:hypothetical protein